MKTTKKSLLASGLVLLLCAAMLIGATFAWFTDTVRNTGNTIAAGNLDVSFQYRDLDSAGTYQVVPETAAEMGKLFANQLWEPGYTNGLDLKVVNEGDLALKWQLYFTNVVSTDATDDDTASDIADVLDVYLIGVEEDESALTEANKLGTLSALADGFVDSGVLRTKGEETAFSVVLKMQESAGNTYQGCSVAFDVELRATQATYEKDGFGSDQYDASADGSPDEDWGTMISGSVEAEKPADGWAETTTLSMNGIQMEVPKAAIDDSASKLVLRVTPTAAPSGIQIAADELASSYEITVEGLAEGNTEEIPVSLYVGKNLVNVRLYHNTAEITDFTYDESTGVLSFRTASFSPFTVVSEGKLVAYVNGTPYASFSKALVAANHGGTVELAGDMDEPLTFGWTEDWTKVGPSTSEPNTYGRNLYSYTIDNVTLTSAGSGVVAVKGMDFASGKVSAADPTDASKSSYDTKLVISGLTVKNIRFTDAVTMGSTSKGCALVNGVTFENCTFDMTSSTATYKDAIIFDAPTGKSEGDKYFTTDTVIRGCEFVGCRRSIGFDKSKNATITGCTFTGCAWGMWATDVVGALNFMDNVLSNGEGAIDINTVANNYNANDYTSYITVTGNVMTGMTNAHICHTGYDNGKSSGKSTYTISDNDWGGASIQGFVIERTYGPSQAQVIDDTAPRA